MNLAHGGSSSRSALKSSMRRFKGGAPLLRRWPASAVRHEMAPPVHLAAYHTVGDVVRWRPETIEALAEMGFAPVRSVILRRTLLKRVTLAQAAAHAGYPLARLLDRLNCGAGAPMVEKECHSCCMHVCDGCAEICGRGNVVARSEA